MKTDRDELVEVLQRKVRENIDDDRMATITNCVIDKLTHKDNRSKYPLVDFVFRIKMKINQERLEKSVKHSNVLIVMIKMSVRILSSKACV